ncbi:hypothetical protein [Tessaracoccus lacteus]|uniref:Uncharacterized protein n=1 Tax=Tessaracoccus lacteus TaxID=3041766 RepID=A0ABY8PXU7_9ACTN|nr:hypothetical protein [Tessaracoccus sp. T21]WGT47298.1 hypothetical protein QH948_00485 [Tessaracoccus sp. T21]
MSEPEAAGNAKEVADKAAHGIMALAREKSTQIAELSHDIADSTKDRASDALAKVTTKKPDPYPVAIEEYNAAYTTMQDAGLALLRQRERSLDLIGFVEVLVNSVANTPKAFEAAFNEVAVERAFFLSAEEFARMDLEAARKSALGAGAGLAGGVAVASIAPTTALWVATTFGTASTGTAISTLSGAVASNAALAWLGGGAITAGGGGMAAGSALLALAGPIGWTIAGASVLTSIALFSVKKHKTRKAQQSELTKLRARTVQARSTGESIRNLLERTESLREMLSTSYGASLPFFGADYLSLSIADQSRLATLVNNTKAAAALLSQLAEQEMVDD